MVSFWFVSFDLTGHQSYFVQQFIYNNRFFFAELLVCENVEELEIVREGWHKGNGVLVPTKKLDIRKETRN